jgi:CRISPR/Cas system-associated exonuclease Cas4 (RecB family)
MANLVFSYSMLSAYEACPRKMHAQYIAKTVKSTWTQDQGVNLHKAMENRIRNGTPLPKELQKAEPVVASLLKIQGAKIALEMKMGATVDWQPSDFFAPRKDMDPVPWLRGAPDVNVYGSGLNANALLVDWKTGKPRDNELQHSINAMLTFCHYPRVNKIEAFNFYTKIGEMGPVSKYTREWMPEVRRAIERRTDEVQAAVESNYFPAVRGGLCGWCAVATCEHNRNPEIQK